MLYRLRVVIPLIMVFVLSACASASAGRGDEVKLSEPTSAKMGMIIGRLDDAASSDKITYLTIWDAKPRMRHGYMGLPVHLFPDGTFVAENVEPGKYIVVALSSGPHMATVSSEQPLVVEPGKAAYWGAYKVDFKSGSRTFGIPSSVTLTKAEDQKAKVFAVVLNAAKGTMWERVTRSGM